MPAIFGYCPRECARSNCPGACRCWHATLFRSGVSQTAGASIEQNQHRDMPGWHQASWTSQFAPAPATRLGRWPVSKRIVGSVPGTRYRCHARRRICLAGQYPRLGGKDNHVRARRSLPKSSAEWRSRVSRTGSPDCRHRRRGK